MFDPVHPPTPATLTLPDGRTLAWYEFGDPHGLPCVYTPGTPGSGLGGAVYDDRARAAGIRWISLDKPGYGRSDFQPGRTLGDWPRDIDHLAQHLHLDRFATVGESGGGPYALALAAGLPERLTCALVIAGMGETWDDPDGKLMPANRQLADAAHDPAKVAAIVAQQKAELDDPEAARRFWDRIRAHQPAADREIRATHPDFDTIIEAAVTDAYRTGIAGVVHELTALTPWNFDLATIPTHVHLWHGIEDANVPITTAYRIAERLPHRTTHWLAGAGHNIGPLITDDILATIRAAAARPTEESSDAR